jgi:nitrite reductase (NADH) small subunit
MTMATDITLGPISQIPPGEGRVFAVGTMKLAVFHDRDRNLFATQPDCPHLGGPLADGLLGSGTLVCPLHDRSFDLRTGESSAAGCRIRTYPTRLEADQIVVTVGL